MNKWGIAIVVALTFGSLQGSGQDFIDTVYFNHSWQECVPKEASYYRVITNDTAGTYQFVVKDYYMTGQLQMSGKYKSINPDYKLGRFNYYYSNGEKYLQCNFSNNSLDGWYKEWFENGVQKLTKMYTLGKLNGTATCWDEKGNLLRKVNYKNDKKHGEFCTYYSNGTLKRKDIYKNDSLVKGACYASNGNDTSYYDYIEPPKFKGGLTAFSKFILHELQYPEEAKKLNIEGQVFVKFSISKEGNVTKVSIIKKDKEYFNQEALRVIQKSPAWIPGKKDGKPFEFSITFPIQFKLNPQ